MALARWGGWPAVQRDPASAPRWRAAPPGRWRLWPPQKVTAGDGVRPWPAVLDSLDCFAERGAATNIAALVVAIVVAGGVAQHIVKWVWPNLGALPVSIGDRVGVHGVFLSSCSAKAAQWVIATSQVC